MTVSKVLLIAVIACVYAIPSVDAGCGYMGGCYTHFVSTTCPGGCPDQGFYKSCGFLSLGKESYCCCPAAGTEVSYGTCLNNPNRVWNGGRVHCCNGAGAGSKPGVHGVNYGYCRSGTFSIDELCPLNQCEIGGVCKTAGTVNPSNSCQRCETSVNRKGWSNRLDRCHIGGTCHTNGTPNPSSFCEKCNTAVNRNDWSRDSDRGCWLSQTSQCVEKHKTLPQQPCDWCDPPTSSAYLVKNPAKCSVGAACYDHGTVDSVSPCRICNSPANGYGWSWRPGYCHIGETNPDKVPKFCAIHGSTDPSNPCNECDTGVEAVQWTNDDTNTCPTPQFGNQCAGTAHCQFNTCTDNFDAFKTTSVIPSAYKHRDASVGVDFTVTAPGGAVIYSLGARDVAFSGDVVLYQRNDDGTVSEKVRKTLPADCGHNNQNCRGQSKFADLPISFPAPFGFKGTIVSYGYSARDYYKTNPAIASSYTTACTHLESKDWAGKSIENIVTWGATRSGNVANSYPQSIGYNLFRSTCSHVPAANKVPVSVESLDGSVVGLATLPANWTIHTTEGFSPTIPDSAVGVSTLRNMRWLADVSYTRYVLDTLVVAGYRDEAGQRIEYETGSLVAGHGIAAKFNELHGRSITGVSGGTVTASGTGTLTVTVYAHTAAGAVLVSQSFTGIDSKIQFAWNGAGIGAGTIAVYFSSDEDMEISTIDFNVDLSNGEKVNYLDSFDSFKPTGGWSYQTTVSAPTIPYNGGDLSQYTPLNWDGLSQSFKAGTTWAKSVAGKLNAYVPRNQGFPHTNIIFSYQVKETDQEGIYFLNLKEGSVPAKSGLVKIYHNQANLLTWEDVGWKSIQNLEQFDIHIKRGDIVQIGIASDSALTLQDVKVSLNRRFVDMQGPSLEIGPTPACQVNGVCVPDGTVDSNNPCLSCDVRATIGGFTADPTAACSTCNSDACQCSYEGQCEDKPPEPPTIERPEEPEVPQNPPPPPPPPAVDPPTPKVLPVAALNPQCDPIATPVETAWFGTDDNLIRQTNYQTFALASWAGFSLATPDNMILGVGFDAATTDQVTQMCLHGAGPGRNVGEYIEDLLNIPGGPQISVPTGFLPLQDLKVTQVDTVVTLGDITTTAPYYDDITLRFTYADSTLIAGAIDVKDILGSVNFQAGAAYLEGKLELNTPGIKLGEFDVAMSMEFGANLTGVPTLTLTFDRANGDKFPLIPGLVDLDVTSGSVSYPDGPVTAGGDVYLKTPFGPLGTYSCNLELAWANGLGKGIPDAVLDVTAVTPIDLPIIPTLVTLTPTGGKIDTGNKFASITGDISVDLSPLIDLGTYTVTTSLQFPSKPVTPPKNANDSQVGSNGDYSATPNVTIDITAAKSNAPLTLIPKLISITPTKGQIQVHNRYFLFESDLHLGDSSWIDFGEYTSKVEFTFKNGYSKAPAFKAFLKGKGADGAKQISLIPNFLKFKGTSAGIDSERGWIGLSGEVFLLGFGTFGAALDLRFPQEGFKGSPNITFELTTKPSVSLTSMFDDFGVDVTPFTSVPVLKPVFEATIVLQRLKFEDTSAFTHLVFNIGIGRAKFYLIPGYVMVTELGFSLDTKFQKGTSTRSGETAVGISARWTVAGSSALVSIQKRRGEFEISAFWEELSLRKIAEHFVGTLPQPLPLVLDLFTIKDAKMSALLSDPSGSSSPTQTSGGNIVPSSGGDSIKIFRVSGRPVLLGETGSVEIAVGKWKKKTIAMAAVSIEPANVMQKIGELVGADLSKFDFQLASGSFLTIIASNRHVDTFLNPRLQWELAPSQSKIAKGLEFRFGMKLPPDCKGDALCTMMKDTVGPDFAFLVAIGVEASPFQFRLFAGINDLVIGSVTIKEAGLGIVIPVNVLKTEIFIQGSSIIQVGAQHRLKLALKASFRPIKLEMDIDAAFVGFLPYFSGIPFLTAGDFYVFGRISKDPLIGVGGALLIGTDCLNQYGRMDPAKYCLLASAGFGIGVNDMFVTASIQGLNLKNIIRMLAGPSAPPLPDFLQGTGFHGVTRFAFSTIEKTLPTGQELIKGLELEGDFGLFDFLPRVRLLLKIPLPAEVLKLILDIILLVTTGTGAARLGPRMIAVAAEFLSGYEMIMEASLSGFSIANGLLQLCRNANDCVRGPRFRFDFTLAPADLKFDFNVYISGYLNILNFIKADCLIVFKPLGVRIRFVTYFFGIKASFLLDANANPFQIANAGFQLAASFDAQEFNKNVLGPVNDLFLTAIDIALEPFRRIVKLINLPFTIPSVKELLDGWLIRIDFATIRMGLSVDAAKGNGIFIAMRGLFFGNHISLSLSLNFGDVFGRIAEFFDKTVVPFLADLVYFRPTHALQCETWEDQELFMCYNPCPAGYSGVAFTCMSHCPSGYTDTGLTCTSADVYWKGFWGGCRSGYTKVLGFCTRVSVIWKSIHFRSGRPVHTCRGEEQQALFCYPWCKSSHFGFLNTCLKRL